MLVIRNLVKRLRAADRKIEGLALVGFIVYRRRSLALSLRRVRTHPFLLYCWTLTLIYVMLFQAFGNFGLLVRQRSIVLPALYLLLSLRTEVEAESSGSPPASSVTGEPRPSEI